MSLDDLGAIGIVSFVVALLLLVIGVVVVGLVDGFSAVPQFNNTDAQAQFASMKETAYKYDWIFFGVFLGLTLAMIITAWFVAGNPIFLVLYFLGSFVFILVSFPLSNAWEGISTHAFFSGMLAHMPITNFMMLRLPLFMSVLAFLGIVIMFAKPRIDGGYA